MVSARVRAGGRNAAVGGATAIAIGLLFLYPTSTSSGHRRAVQASPPAGAVATQAPQVPAPVGIVPGAVSPYGGMTMVHDGVEMVDDTPVLVVNGTSVDTAYGPVQVQIHVREGQIVYAAAIAYPQETLVDKAINNTAVPTLQNDTLIAQSAGIDTVSGATQTSEAYKESLQAALDAAHL